MLKLGYPADLQTAVDDTVELWKQFCSLSDDVKSKLPYSNNADGVGYELKDGTGNKTDRKENFDVSLMGQEWLQEHIKTIQDPIALDFVSNAVNLTKLMKPLIVSFAQQCEDAFSLESFATEVQEGIGIFFVRFIHYFGDCQLGDETAVAHADQSGFTLHLFESAPGLQCLTRNNAWIDMSVSSTQTVIIPSMQMQLRSRGELKALCHRVIATSETVNNGRYSAVCFVQLQDTAKYDKDNHGRLQEKIPGFNYDLSHAEFAQFFKQ